MTNNEGISKSNINWFPGHMQKAIREIGEKIKLVDIVYEVVDARIPYSSSIPNIKKIANGKPILVLLNKSNLADPIMTKKWIKKFESDGIFAIDIDCVENININKIETKTKEILKEKIEKKLSRGLKAVTTRAMIVGIPNSGKSTLINKLSKRKAASVGDKPGITKAQQWIKVGNSLEMLDTPGILWPKFDDDVAFPLAVTGAIKDSILPIDEVAVFLIKFLNKYYKENFIKRYNLEEDLDDVEKIYESISRSRGCLKNGKIDYDRITKLILKDYRDNLIGRITIDRNV